MASSNKDYVFVIALFLLVFASRLMLLSNISEYDSQTYFALRQAESIRETGSPTYTDSLSYSGRIFFFPPLFHYLTAFIALFCSIENAAKILTSISLSSLVIIVYAISRHLTKSKPIAFATSIFAAVMPALFISLESLTPASLSVALIFLLSYCLLRLDEPGFAPAAIAVALLSMLTSAQAFIILLGIVLYFLLLVIERIKTTTKEFEISVFIIFLTIWFYVLLYKKAFFANGIAVFWNNTPLPIIQNYFESVSFFGILYALGIVPLFLGIYAIYNTAFETKNKQVLFFIGFAAVSFGFLWLRIFPLQSAIIFFSINMIILSGHTMKITSNALSMTKVESIKTVLGVIAVAIFLLSSIAPLSTLIHERNALSEDMQALAWIANNTPKDSVVLGSVSEGFKINYISERKNVADENFLFQKHASKTYQDISEIYSLKLSSEAIRLLDKHGINYILLSTDTKTKLNMTRLFYDDNSCISLIYGNTSTLQPVIYEFNKCKIGDEA